MPGLIRGVARTAVIAGTATSVSNRVSRRQGQKWAQQEEQQMQQQAPAPVQAAPAPAARFDDRSTQGTGRAEKPGDPDRGGVRGPEGQDPRVLGVARGRRLVEPDVPLDRGARDLPAVGVGEQDLAREDDLALGVEGLEGLGRRRRRASPVASIRPVGDLFVGDLGAAGQRRDLAEALGEGADEGRPGRGLGRR